MFVWFGEEIIYTQRLENSLISLGYCSNSYGCLTIKEAGVSS